MELNISTSLKYCSELCITNTPEWLSSHTTIIEENAFNLLKFPFHQEASAPPVLIIPPQAGHHSSIADFGSQAQSLVQTALAATQNHVYALDWKNSRRLQESLDDLVIYLDTCVAAVGRKVHLIGLCQGGWLAAIYAALYPERVASLLIGAAPIDFKAGKSKLHKFVENIPMEGYEWIIRSGGGVLKGDFMLHGWKLTSPYERFFQDYFNLWDNVKSGSEEKLKRSKIFRTWYDYTQNISGKWYLQAVKELFKKNRLVKKELKLLHRIVDLGQITCPIAMLAGEKDDITPHEQVFALGGAVGTPGNDQYKVIIPKSGHIGVFMRENSQPYWAQALEFTTREDYPKVN